MALTYEPLASTTLSSAAASITFSSISAAYTDLRVVLTGTVSTAVSPSIQFNSATTGYSQTSLWGSGSAAATGRTTNQTNIYILYGGNMYTSTPSFATIDIFSYTGSTYKTCLMTGSTDNNGSGYTEVNVGLWRNTAAITNIKLYPDIYNFSVGTTATLYGILRA